MYWWGAKKKRFSFFSFLTCNKKGRRYNLRARPGTATGRIVKRSPQGNIKGKTINPVRLSHHRAIFSELKNVTRKKFPQIVLKEMVRSTDCSLWLSAYIVR